MNTLKEGDFKGLKLAGITVQGVAIADEGARRTAGKEGGNSYSSMMLTGVIALADC